MKFLSRDISHCVKTFGVAKTTSTSAISVDESGSSSQDTFSVSNDTSVVESEKVRYFNLYTDHEGETSTHEIIASDQKGNSCLDLHLVNDNIPIELTDQGDNSSLNLNSEVSLVDQNPTLSTSDSSIGSPTSNLSAEDLEESVQLSTMDDDSDGLDSEVSLAEVPNHLREILEEDELYSSIKANLLLFEGSSVTVLQALCGYLNCPICNSKRFRTARKPARKFYYYPLGPCWKRMFGNPTVAEVLESHDIADEDHPSGQCVDIIGSPLWKKVYDDGGFFEGERRGISTQLSTDGVNPFSSNKVIYSMWLIMLTVLNLPKRI